jgi:hypothetical protein
MSESPYHPTDLNPALIGGLRELTRDTEIVFSQHVRKVLPLDGYVFWLKVQQTTLRGSLHTSATLQQLEDETVAVNTVVFTTNEQIQDFDLIAPTMMWVGEWDNLRFAFSQQGNFFEAAGLYHYIGQALGFSMDKQLLDLGEEPPDDTLIVSNSLPAWLAIKDYRPVWLQPDNIELEIFPSFLVPQNCEPPFGTIHIEPSGTRPLAAFPTLGKRFKHTQLSRDTVRLTFYGLTNERMMDWYETMIRYSEDHSYIGMGSMPVVKDEKKIQVEFGILGMKKTMDLEVNYLQSQMRDLARQMILSAKATVTATW